MGEVQGAFSRDDFVLVSTRCESLGLGLQGLPVLGRKLEAIEGIRSGAMQDVDTIEGLFWSRAELVKVSHFVKWILPSDKLGGAF
jgi:hypothetical protein